MKRLRHRADRPANTRPRALRLRARIRAATLPARVALRADAVPPLRPQRPEAAARSRWACGRTSATTGRSPTAARSCGARSTSGSRTSTWPTTTARRTAAPRPTSGGSSPRTSRPYRDELVISTKAGYDMWPGPYGEWGSRKYLLASLDQCLQRMRPRLRRHLLLAPLRSRHAAGGDDGRARHRGARGQGALRRDLHLRARAAPRRPRSCCADLGTPLLIHQPSYSMFNRWIEAELLDVLEREGVGCDRVLAAGPGAAHRQVPRRDPGGLARAPRQLLLVGAAHRREPRARPRAERDRRSAAASRWRSWRSRGRCATSASPPRWSGASSVAQLEQNVAALEQPTSTPTSSSEIDRYAVDGALNIWSAVAG